MTKFVVGTVLVLSCATFVLAAEEAKVESKKAGDTTIAEMSCDSEHGAAKADAKASGSHFGAPFKLADQEIVPAEKVLADAATYSGKSLKIQGKVGAVCDEKGCWLTVTDSKSKDTIFIKFPDPKEGRLIPTEAVGHEVIVEGTFVVGKVSEKFAKHIKAEQGASEAELEKIVGPQPIMTFKTPGVEILGLAATTQPAKDTK